MSSLRYRLREFRRWARLSLGLRQPLSLELVRFVADIRPGDTVIDIGANVGLFSRAAGRAVGADGVVIAVEPNPAVLKWLHATIRGLPNVKVEAVGVGAEQGTAILYRFRRDDWSSFVRDARSTRPLNDNERRTPVTVSVEPILSILNRHKIARVDALKIDIEGYEDRALIPFFETAPRHLWPRRIMIEFSPKAWERDCIAYLQSRGYGVAWKSDKDRLMTLPEGASVKAPLLAE